MSDFIFFDEKDNMYYKKKFTGEVSTLYLLNDKEVIKSNYLELLNKYNIDNNIFNNIKLNKLAYNLINSLINVDVSKDSKQDKYKLIVINSLNTINSLKDKNNIDKIEELYNDINLVGSKWAKNIINVSLNQLKKK